MSSLGLNESQVATEADIASLRHETNKQIEAIKNTDNLTPTTSTVYYVSSSMGSDSNSGTSPDAPFKTISKVNSVIASGTTVCFKRGDTWRGQLVAVSNLTITAYGTGAKPVIMASPENGGGAANASKWTEVKPNIWRYEGSNSWSDVGNIVFNDGECYAKKIVQLYVKQESWSNYQLTDFTTGSKAQKIIFDSWDDLSGDLDFFHDRNFEGGSEKTGYLYLYSETNPALRFDSIEFSIDQHIVTVYKLKNVTIDNICFKYTGAHAIAAQGSSSTSVTNLRVQNCEFYWIGGSIQDRIDASTLENKTNTESYDLRYGNAIEVYGTCDGFYATNNYIYQVYDAGITIQFSFGNNTGTWNQKNIEFSDNVIEYCNYSIEYFLDDIPNNNRSTMSNFVISGNYMWNAGLGFCETRMIWDRGFSAHIKSHFSGNSNKATGFEITDNVMIGARDNILQIRNSYGESSMPLFANNSIYGKYDIEGTAAQSYRIGEITYESTHDYASYNENVEAYIAEKLGSKYGEGNEYYFIID